MYKTDIKQFIIDLILKIIKFEYKILLYNFF